MSQHIPFFVIWFSIVAVQEPEDQAANTCEMVAMAGESTKSWSRWRGASGQGAVTGDDYPDKWSTKKNVLWKVRVPGRGFSSPIVWNDRIFLTTSNTSRKVKDNVVLCYRLSDGKLLWKAVSPTPARGYRTTNLLSAVPTPTTDGERVYTFFGDNVFVLDFNGRKLWHKFLGDLDAHFSIGASPLLYEGQLIVVVVHKGASFITSLDASTGNERWRTSYAAKDGWSSPIAVRVNGQDQIIVTSKSGLNGFDATIGKPLWSMRGDFGQSIPTPVVAHNMVFFVSLKTGIKAVRIDGGADGFKANVVWESMKGRSFVPSPLISGDYLFTINDRRATLNCLEAATGKIIWQGNLANPSKPPETSSLSHTDFLASPVAMNGKIFITSRHGKTYVVTIGPKFDLVHANDLNDRKGRTRASPALASGKWVFRSGGYLWAIALR